MQPLNNDMDHLMRQAADAYSVPPAGQDWDKVAAQLDAGSPPKSTAAQHSRRFGLVLFFLCTSLVCNKYLYLSQLFHPAALRYTNTQKKAEQAAPKSHSMKIDNVIKDKAIEASEPIYRKPVQNALNPFYPQKQTTVVIDNNLDENTKAAEDKPLLAYNHSGLSKTDKSKHFDLNLKTLKNPFAHFDFDKKQNTTINNKPAQQKRWYAGVVAGPDITTVRWKEFESAGYGAGVVLGYRLNDKWAIETGLLWDKKNYYADGGDFYSGKMALPSHSKILHAEGYCQMFEIPITVRYRFAGGKKHQWSLAAGASSYLMQQEDYHYLYERYNVQYYGSKYYSEKQQHWLSAVHLSAGYERPISRGILRIEPYIKLPITGVGTGRLPLTSTGLQVGYTVPIK